MEQGILQKSVSGSSVGVVTGVFEGGPDVVGRGRPLDPARGPDVSDAYQAAVTAQFVGDGCEFALAPARRVTNPLVEQGMFLVAVDSDRIHGFVSGGSASVRRMNRTQPAAARRRSARLGVFGTDTEKGWSLLPDAGVR
ncbi:hypothetical protein ACFUGD_18685 [Streptomyces sp. NPDC057217]|uniref:hypothetical protein n=1 Tax=Streptomyces sp. NPDC057217 TaxID=3346054 RepID=UPI003642015F